MKVICINSGFYNTKVKTLHCEHIHESRMQHNEDADTDCIIVDGNKYEIGEGKRDIGDKLTSSVDTYCTVYNLLKYANEASEANLILALPMGSYLNKKYREAYSNKFNQRTFSHNIDGVNKSIYVNDVTVMMEGGSAMLLYKQWFNSIVGMVDIGGNTVNCAIFKDGKIILDTITTLDLGMIKLERALIDALNIELGLNIQEYEIKDFMKSDNKTVRNVVDAHIKEIRQRLLEKKWNLKHIPIIMTGGGASDLRGYFPNHFNNTVISEYPVMDNVRGLWIAGQVIYK